MMFNHRSALRKITSSNFIPLGGVVRMEVQMKTFEDLEIQRFRDSEIQCIFFGEFAVSDSMIVDGRWYSFWMYSATF